jgi:predicted Rossmann fold nucleotide-binding protein DprA/Smf involved in DNA uptake
MKREHRNPMLDGQLALISPYDRNAGFNVGNAMQRNKLIYALADAALVMSCDLKKGGTWAGATEQLDKYRMIPVYVRSTDESLPGMDALLQKGAVPWPNPQDVDEFGAVNESPSPFVTASKKSLPSAPWQADPPDSDTTTINQALNPAAALFSVVREIILDLLKNPMNADEIAAALDVNKNQAQAWVKRLVEEDRVQKSGKPLRYVARQPGLFPGHLRQNNL